LFRWDIAKVRENIMEAGISSGFVLSLSRWEKKEQEGWLDGWVVKKKPPFSLCV
jgi:hypothetical protein